MTRAELSRLHYIRQHIEVDKLKLEQLRAAAQSLTANITGMPRSGAGGSREYILIEIAELEETIKEEMQACQDEQNKLMRWIENIDDPMIRDIIFLRYVMDQTWLQVAINIGGDNTEDNVRMMASRFISAHCQANE